MILKIQSLLPSRSSARPARRHGFTLIELLVAVAIIGIIAALLIPNFLASLNKAKQRRTMADMHKMGQAMMNWLTSQVGASAAGATVDLSVYGGTVPAADLRTLLVPEVLAVVPAKDAWGSDFDYYLNTNDPLAIRVMAIRSAGLDGAFSGTTYDISAFATTDFNQDIVWADGVFVRWPQGSR